MVARTRLSITLYLNCLSYFSVHNNNNNNNNQHHHHHHHLANMDLGHWLTRSDLTRLRFSLNVSLGLNVKVINLPKIILFNY